jgi:uncharacterized metal-binding protein YceD (DUF177 family)
MENPLIRIAVGSVIQTGIGLDEKYNVGETFLQTFQQEIIQKGLFDVLIQVQKKTSNSLEIQFQVDGWVELVCDRSLQKFHYPIQSSDRISIKLGDRFEEITENAYIIPESTQHFVADQILFDIIALSIPSKKIHPDFRTEEDQSESNQDFLVYTTEQHKNEELIDEDITLMDPRWEALKKLKNKN